MKTVFMHLLLLGILALSHPALAEFYKYIDENGNILFTDDLSKVPEDQRQNLKSYEEVPPDPDSGFRKVDADREKSVEELNRSRDDIAERKAQLDNEYQEMLRERADLEIQKKNAITDEQIKAYNQKVTAFNEKMRQFEEKRKALEAEIEKFRKKQSELNANQ
jgi:chromosome segregation ATPase